MYNFPRQALGPHRTVGRTPLRNIPALNEAFHVPNLQIKDESTNPSGTWKDRRSLYALSHLKGNPDPHVCLITAGNAAMSIATLCEGLNVRITAVVDQEIKPEIRTKLEGKGVRTVSAQLNRQFNPTEVQRAASTHAKDNPIDITYFLHRAYASLIHELDRHQPDYIVVPYGTGEALYGLATENYRSNLFHPHHSSKLVGVKPSAHPSQADKISGHISIYPDLLREFDQYEMRTVEVNETEIAEAYEAVKDHLDVEPSSAATFAALSHLPLKASDKVVIINSGRGIF